MSVKFANNAFGTLNAGISNSATSVTLSSGQGARFPTLASGEYFYATLIDTSNNLEVVKCTARSSDVLTVTRAQESTTARAFAIGDRLELRVTAAALEDSSNPYDKDTSSTGSFALPVGTTAQQPTAADTEGHIRYDSDDNVVYYSDGASWIKVSAATPILTSVTGNIYAGATSTLTLAGSGFLSSNLVVNFLQISDSIDADVTVTPTSDTAATVTVPSAVYSNVTSGNVVAVTATNSDGVTSAAVNKTALALPSGGTVTTTGSYRVHTFTSSGTFTNTVSNLSVEYLVIAGGGGVGSRRHAGGGGAGGYRSSVSGESSGGGASAETALSLATGNHTVTIGAGGASSPDTFNSNSGVQNGSNSVFSSITSLGGGWGSTYNGGNGASGGSGGGAGARNASAASGGSGTSGQGYAGGNGQPNTGSGGGGGGGGAGAAGQNGGISGENGGNGGTGVQSSINGTATYRAGGGGGAGSTSATPGSGGSGGGGNGANSSSGTPQSGTANTGGGAGAGGGEVNYGQQGGSGIVIVRYQL